MFPRPTADPVAARIKAQRDDHWPCMEVRLIAIIFTLFFQLIVREISNSLNSVVPPFSADGIGSPRLNIQVT
jgi:hypothetical protein